MGSGDWNDGMNRVGEHAKGKASGWDSSYMKCPAVQGGLRVHGDVSFAERCETERPKCARICDQNGWDGEWYLRAYFDDVLPWIASNPNAR